MLAVCEVLRLSLGCDLEIPIWCYFLSMMTRRGVAELGPFTGGIGRVCSDAPAALAILWLKLEAGSTTLFLSLNGSFKRTQFLATSPITNTNTAAECSTFLSFCARSRRSIQ